MAYTKLKEMTGREGIKHYNEEDIYTLKGAALAFIRERCENLRFNDKKNQEESSENYLGKSLEDNQIPYNMEKDIDRLCLENALNRFLKSGRKEDAFDVYFCYLEMFVGNYAKTRRIIELLAEFEANGSALLMKHRDHYSHSVYVFALGLAIYQTNEGYREAYNRFYHCDGSKAAAHYLTYWGLTSLFHDIGYPFELPYEQVASYFEVNHKKREGQIYLAYQSMDILTSLEGENLKDISELYGRKFKSTNELFAFVIYGYLKDGGYDITEGSIMKALLRKPSHPEEFNYCMDHAYFSANVLFKKLFLQKKGEPESNLELKECMDALTAIIMHNSLYKFCITNYKLEEETIPLKADLHPLAYMLMLCDELQCWDRCAYGRDSRLQVHPVDCEFIFKKNDGNGITATYVYDEEENGPAIEKYEHEYEEWKNHSRKRKPKLKAYSEMKYGTFQKDIEKIVDCECIGGLKVDIKISAKEKDDENMDYLSNSNFIGLYNFALVLHNRWSQASKWNTMTDAKKKNFYLHNKKNKYIKDFDKLSLEYKLSNINQAKAFAKYLNEIGCFYTMNIVNFKMVNSFTEDELKIIGPLEHQRWLQERYDMGWIHGNTTDREGDRVHPDLIEDLSVGETGVVISREQAKENYMRLNKEEQDKDTDPMECMLAMLKMFDGLRIYRLRN